MAADHGKDSSSMETLSSFLSGCIDRLEQHASPAGQHKLNAVLGNTSGDLDSVCAAIAKAWLLTMTGVPSYPVMNFPSEDLPLRILLFYWLQHVLHESQAEANMLERFCIDQPLILKGMETSRPWTLTIVDHNELSPTQRDKWQGRVTRITDHHKDESHAYEHQDDIEKNISDPSVGSCCTLIAEEWFASGAAMPREAALLLLGPILTDTGAFAPELKGSRWSDRDESAREQLCKVVGWDESRWREAARMLQDAKFDVKENLSMGLANLLRSDFKLYHYGQLTVGYSSLTIPLEACFTDTSDDTTDHALMHHMERNGLDLLIIMAWKLQPTMSREMAVCVRRDDERADEIVRSIAGISELQLSPMELPWTPKSTKLAAFFQGNDKASRKIAEPLIRGCLSGVTGCE
ncbi:unnamed protein product [Vitrella brassicaformis CCMP3155]|uniref:DHHA2 domain-containing protein n=1 Tax=Vitrella brassicaformis (strain CCMP3155) TaxID=1169540 RepID=A0A0G4EC02_VITBC|nr:unnamed protein product [Vitrella brassicaformis CCMP3155]|eukprot:CEL93520.1 unnamed protein product [Vitrella brassicaformis CCMP3155]